MNRFLKWPTFPQGFPGQCLSARSSRSHLVMMLFLGSRDMNTGRVRSRGCPQNGCFRKFRMESRLKNR